MLKYFDISYQYNKEHMGKRIQENKRKTENKQKQEVTDKKVQLKIQTAQYVQQRNVIKIQARNLQDDQMYFGEVDPNVISEHNQVKFLLNYGKQEILSQDQNSIKVKIGHFILQLVSLQKLSIEQLRETLKLAKQRESQLQKIAQTYKRINERYDKILQFIKTNSLQLPQQTQSDLIQKYDDVNVSIIEERKINQISEEQKSNQNISTDPIIQSTNQQNQQLMTTQITSAVQMELNLQIEQDPNTCQNDNQSPQQ